jgi:hypothetical protein
MRGSCWENADEQLRDTTMNPIADFSIALPPVLPLQGNSDVAS